MKNYKIFKHQDGRIEAVKQGWSWPGFFFGLIWALVKKLWNVAGALVAVMIAFWVISFALIPNPNDYTSYYEFEQAMSAFNVWDKISTVISLIIAIFIGSKGNSFRESNLLKNGYVLIGTAIAANPDMAILETQKAQSDTQTSPVETQTAPVDTQNEYNNNTSQTNNSSIVTNKNDKNDNNSNIVV